MINKIITIVCLIILGACQSVFAMGTNYSLNYLNGQNFGYDHLGVLASNKLSTSSVIQLIIGDPGEPDPNAPNFLHSGMLKQSLNIGYGTAGTAGTFNLNTNNSSLSEISYLRFWENGGPQKDGYYITKGPYYPGDPLPSENIITSFQTNYKAAAPYKPIITKISVSGATATSASDLTAVSDQPQPTDGIREVTSCTWKMWKEGQAEPADHVAGQTKKKLSTTISKPIPGEKYYFKVYHQNYFGGVWSDQKPLIIPGSAKAMKKSRQDSKLLQQKI